MMVAVVETVAVTVRHLRGKIQVLATVVLVVELVAVVLRQEVVQGLVQ